MSWGLSHEVKKLYSWQSCNLNLHTNKLSYVPLKGAGPKSMDSRWKSFPLSSVGLVSVPNCFINIKIASRATPVKLDFVKTSFRAEKLYGNLRGQIAPIPHGPRCVRTLTTGFSVRVKEIPSKQVNLRTSILGGPLHNIFKSPRFWNL